MPDGTPHQPTDETRAQVSALITYGVTQEQIAKFIGIAPMTLFKYYRTELDTSAVKANAAVANKLYNKAVNQDDLSAQIFWLKCRARWRTQDVINVADENDRLKTELKELRAELDKKNKKDY